MAIPPQQYNLLLRGDEHFDCPTCQRIMYYEPVEEVEEVKVPKEKSDLKKRLKKPQRRKNSFTFSVLSLYKELERVHDRSGLKAREESPNSAGQDGS